MIDNHFLINFFTIMNNYKNYIFFSKLEFYKNNKKDIHHKQILMMIKLIFTKYIKLRYKFFLR